MPRKTSIECFALPEKNAGHGLYALHQHLISSTEGDRQQYLGYLWKTLRSEEQIIAGECLRELCDIDQLKPAPHTILLQALLAVYQEVLNELSPILLTPGVRVAGQELYVVVDTGALPTLRLLLRVRLLKALGVLELFHDPGQEVYNLLHHCTVEIKGGGYREVLPGHSQYNADEEDKWDEETIEHVDALLTPYYAHSDVTVTPPSPARLPQVAVRVEGGVVAAIASEVPVELLVVDYDVDGSEELSQVGGNNCRIWTEDVPVDEAVLLELRTAKDNTTQPEE